MHLLMTALLLLLYASLATVLVSGLPGDPDAGTSEAARQARINQLSAVNNASVLAVGDTCGPVTGAAWVSHHLTSHNKT